jgi:hypothetical protein
MKVSQLSGMHTCQAPSARQTCLDASRLHFKLTAMCGCKSAMLQPRHVNATDVCMHRKAMVMLCFTGVWAPPFRIVAGEGA